MAAHLLHSIRVIIKLLIYIDINPRISLASALKKMQQIFDQEHTG